MSQFEYRIETPCPGLVQALRRVRENPQEWIEEGLRILNLLKPLGLEGWELVAVEGPLYIFKRRKKAK